MKKGDLQTYAMGAGAYYAGSYILAFYPAFILAVQAFLIFRGEAGTCSSL